MSFWPYLNFIQSFRKKFMFIKIKNLNKFKEAINIIKKIF